MFVVPGAEEAPQDLAALTERRREEAAALRAEIARARLEARQLRLRLQALGVTDPSLIPGQVRAGSGCGGSQCAELQSLLGWLADGVDITRQVSFECGSGAVAVGGRQVLLQRMVSWPLLGSGLGALEEGGLKLSVPVDLQAEILKLIEDARGPGGLRETSVRRLADAWEVVGAEVMSAVTGRPEPAVFLVRRETSHAIVVAKWPTVDIPPCEPAAFDPELHFACLAAEPAPSGGAAPPAPVASPAHAAGMPADAGAQPRPGSPEAFPPKVASGDRVEVEYGGRWLPGVLQLVSGGVASVKCDVDSPGVITVAPLTSVRPAQTPAPEASPKAVTRRRVRARSVG